MPGSDGETDETLASLADEIVALSVMRDITSPQAEGPLYDSIRKMFTDSVNTAIATEVETSLSTARVLWLRLALQKSKDSKALSPR